MLERMERVGLKNKHGSVLEHVNYTWDIDGISRACLQELARHRHQSLSVKSTRYTLKELKEANDVGNFLVKTGDDNIDATNRMQLRSLQYILQQSSLPNDILKYAIPEAYKTSLVSTMNMRAFRNFLELRTSRAALWEIQNLALEMYKVIPDEHKFLFNDILGGDNERMA
jgi:thymidylate synthase (FAD)